MPEYVAIVDQYFTDESFSRDVKPKATFVVGQLCAGKTTYRRKHCVKDFVLVDAGDVYLKLNNGSWLDFGKNKVSDMKQVCFAIAARAVMQKRNIVCELLVDSKDVVRVFQAVQDGLSELGYSINIVDLDCDPETAKKRNVTRQTDNISAYYTTRYALSTLMDVVRVKKSGELESGICDVCGTRVRYPGGHLLTTRQVVGCPGYWEKVFEQQRESLQLRGVSSFEDLKKNAEVRTELAEHFASESTPWLVCSSCISMFPVDAGATHLHAKRWWECAAVYDLPGVGAVPLSAVNMGDGGKMKKVFFNFLSGIIFLAVFFSIGQSGDACTTFQLQHGKQLVVGKNFDFHTDIGMVIINKRNVAKTALLRPPEKPAQWVSKYGSITFNQVGREFPFSGINEDGLIVEIMWLDESKYPDPDERAAISELQWIQYQLDNNSSVDEVIKSDAVIRITQSSPVHFFVGDNRGKAVTIEFIDGKLVFHTADNLPVKVLTNHTYQESLQYLQTRQGFGGQGKFSFTRSSLDRFATAAKKIKDYQSLRQPSIPILEYAFDILSAVSQGKATVWSIVYDVTDSRIYFKTVRENEIKIILFREVDFTCGPPVKVLDMNTDLKGNVTKQFVDYTTEMNRKMVFSVFNNYKANNFMNSISDPALEVLARFPETLMCKQ